MMFSFSYVFHVNPCFLLLAISDYGCLLCYILFLPLSDYANEANLHTRTEVHGIVTILLDRLQLG